MESFSKKKLVVVESPGKIQKIQKILGDEYIVKASCGHCRDLAPKELSIDVDNNFKPKYQVIPDKRKIVKELISCKDKCSEVILAMDEDREGEMIASSLRDLLDLHNPKRIIFNEITTTAILKSISNPSIIDENMVLAQQTRRLLDRLVGYKLSPLLWKEIKGDLSAGRVQSVVTKIIIDKEEEINKSISEPYFKTTGEFIHNNNLSSVLMKNNQIYKFNSKTSVDEFLTKLSKNNINKVVDIINKKSVKKPSPPFITSSIQQDSYSKFGFSSDYTMRLLQKLYEAGKITYMRTDSTNLSTDIMKQCEKYIKSTYGDNYSQVKNYTKKIKGGQEAHEAIRPTKITTLPDSITLGTEYKKLYGLIWRRTVASQMSNADINIQNIFIDIIDKNNTILPEKSNFVTTFEKILFDGFLVLYNNHESDNKNGMIDININTDVIFNKLQISEEYTKPPLRYNEAGLIKYLEKNGIGRPSTYASIISKIKSKKYVEIKNIDGIKKNSNIINVSKTYKKSVKCKEVKIGNEKNKICPTEVGIKINVFLNDNFSDIMKISFTAELESQLDKIALGNAKWYNILKMYYDRFNPIVIQLNEKYNDIGDVNNTDELFGNHPDNNKEIYKGKGKFGPYIKIMEDNGSWKFSSIKNIDDLTLESAIEILKWPKELGKINNKKVTLNKGQYGLYFKVGKKIISIKDESKDLNLEYAKELFNTDDPYAIKTFKIDDKTIYLKKGPYGHYLKVKFKSNKTKNIPIPNDYDINNLDISKFITK
uniref:DNA topoisomerase n=1 Tax=Megaviridae environmental sample TaxID=1737588 RepID=A0A5J6VKQ3_9VIRU|nr:MAG: DNA topoisomerase [Megaviridae environmental sample]